MLTSESLGYLKGLMDGLELDESQKETKVFKAIIEVLENMCDDIDDLGEELDLVEEQIDEIDEDLSAVEEMVFDDDFCCEDCCDFDDDEEEYEIECPSCGEVFVVDEETVLDGNFECPSCGEKLEFEIEYDEDEE